METVWWCLQPATWRGFSHWGKIQGFQTEGPSLQNADSEEVVADVDDIGATHVPGKSKPSNGW